MHPQQWQHCNSPWGSTNLIWKHTLEGPFKHLGDIHPPPGKTAAEHKGLAGFGIEIWIIHLKPQGPSRSKLKIKLNQARRLSSSL